MNLIDKAFLLKNTQLFRSLDMEVLLSIAEKAELLSFKPGNVIFSLHQPAYCLYIVAEGSVIVQLHNNCDTQYELFPKDFFGEESLFNNMARQYSVKAHSKVKLLILSKGQIMNIIEECPSVGFTLLEMYTKQITFRKVHTTN